MRRKRYDVALSFSSTDRNFVSAVADRLAETGLTVFYDEHATVDLWGLDLIEELADIYSNRSALVVVFVSASYVESPYTRLERRAALTRAIHSRDEFLLPVRLDDTALPAVLNMVGYIDVGSMSPERLSQLILKKRRSMDLAGPSENNPSDAQSPQLPADRPSMLSQLPSGVPDFVGRDDEVQELIEICSDRQATRSPVIAISGQPGVGKTTLAIELSHRLKISFPDGQIYVDLRGSVGEKVDAKNVLGELLLLMGVDASVIPSSRQERSAAYRALLSNKRLLILLDNATSEDQVRDLRPGNRGCVTIITSRNRLGGLSGSKFLELKTFSNRTTAEFLTRIVGPERVAREEEAVSEIGKLCGGLPLAARIAGTRIAARPDWQIQTFLNRLLDEDKRLRELRVGDLEVRASFSISYDLLASQEKEAFRRLGVLAVPSFPSWVAGAVSPASPSNIAEDALEKLVDSGLLESLPEDAAGQVRYRFHDLLRVFAREKFADDEPQISESAIVRIVLMRYMELTRLSDRNLEPSGLLRLDRPDSIEISGALPTSSSVGSTERALNWFDAELEPLLSLVGQAHRLSEWDIVVGASDYLSEFFYRRARWLEWIRLHSVALEAARRSGNIDAQALYLSCLGKAHYELREFNEAERNFDESLGLWRTTLNLVGEAYVVQQLAVIAWWEGRWTESLALNRRSLQISRERRDLRGAANALLSIGYTLGDKGDWPEAEECHLEALDVAVQLDAISLKIACFGYLGRLRWYEKRLDEALQYTKTAVLLSRSLHAPGREAWALGYLADCHLSLGQNQSAAQALERIAQIQADIGVVDRDARVPYREGLLLRGAGNQVGAMERLKTALTACESSGTPFLHAMILSELGETYRILGEPERAIDCLERASASALALGAIPLAADTLEYLILALILNRNETLAERRQVTLGSAGRSI